MGFWLDPQSTLQQVPLGGDITQAPIDVAWTWKVFSSGVVVVFRASWGVNAAKGCGIRHPPGLG